MAAQATDMAEVIHLVALNPTIAAAVEEQTATTNEMARNVFEASTGSGRDLGTRVDLFRF